MKDFNSIFLYFLGVLLGLVSALFVFRLLPFDVDLVALVHNVVLACFLLVGLVLARVLVVRRQAEELRAEVQSLQEDSSSNTKFVAFAAHEIKNPIATTKWTLSAFISGEYGPLPPEQKALFDRMYGDVKEMEAIAETFLDVSKIKQHVLEITLAPIRLEELEREIGLRIKSRMYLAEKKNIDLRYTAKVDPALVIRVNKTAIQLVVENLVENAINYTLPGGTVTADIQNDAENLIFHISDTGIGIPKSDQPKIFNEFYRAENARAFQASGSGLGLYLSKKYIDGHGGKIWFSSEDSKGTTFSFTIPLYAGSELAEIFRKI